MTNLINLKSNAEIMLAELQKKFGPEVGPLSTVDLINNTSVGSRMFDSRFKPPKPKRAVQRTLVKAGIYRWRGRWVVKDSAGWVLFQGEQEQQRRREREIAEQKAHDNELEVRAAQVLGCNVYVSGGEVIIKQPDFELALARIEEVQRAG